MNVYVFKTSLNKRDVKFIKPILDKTIPDIKWNFDFEDCDRVLRIESDEDIVELVNDTIFKSGFFCLELK